MRDAVLCFRHARKVLIDSHDGREFQSLAERIRLQRAPGSDWSEYEHEVDTLILPDTKKRLAELAMVDTLGFDQPYEFRRYREPTDT